MFTVPEELASAHEFVGDLIKLQAKNEYKNIRMRGDYAFQQREYYKKLRNDLELRRTGGEDGSYGDKGRGVIIVVDDNHNKSVFNIIVSPLLKINLFYSILQ